jgi:hypothetical protein
MKTTRHGKTHDTPWWDWDLDELDEQHEFNQLEHAIFGRRPPDWYDHYDCWTCNGYYIGSST